MKKIITLLLVLLHTGSLLSQDFGNEMFSLFRLKDGIKSKRVSSYDKTGGNGDCLANIKDGATVTLMDVRGAGIISHIWFTLAPEADELSRNDIILRMYWDGNAFPSVESPFGPFFGNGWNESYHFVSMPVSVAPAGGKSYVCYFAMPFATGARIEIENQTGKPIGALYYIIDYYELTSLPKGSGRFHAWYNHEVTEGTPVSETFRIGADNNKNGKGNYMFADIKGKGQFVGIQYYVNCPTTDWYGEGDEMVFIDGDTLPTLNGTGTEDFFNTSWCPKELFWHPCFGYARVNNETGWLGLTHAYRFFISDPICFDRSCLFTIEHGHDNNLTLDLASVAYWYQDKASRLPRSFTREERQHKPALFFKHINKWRDAWILKRDNDPSLWGDERDLEFDRQRDMYIKSLESGKQ